MNYSTNSHPSRAERRRRTIRFRKAFWLSLYSLLFGLVIVQPVSSVAAFSTQEPNQSQGNSQEAIPLEQGKPVERELAGDAVHAYSIPLTAGQFLRVMVDQRGIDVVLSLFAPDGKELIRQGPEPVTVVAQASGTYRLEVRMFESAATPGRYEVKIDELRAAKPEDKRLAEIGDRINRASELNRLGYVYRGQGDFARALKTYQESFALSEAAGNKAWQAYVLNNLGWTSLYQGNYAPAFEYSRRSLALSEELANTMMVADSLNQMSALYMNTGNFAQALECAQRGLAINQSLGKNVPLAQLEISIGLIYASMGDNVRALEHYRRSLAVSELLGRKALIASALSKLADALNAQGDYTQALEYAVRSLALMEEEKAARGTIFSFLSVGRIYLAIGNNSQALEYFQKALALSEKVGERPAVARALNGISNSYFRLGDYAQALEAAQRSFTVAGQIGNRSLQHGALNRIGTAYLYLNQLEEARRAFEQAIEVVETLRSSIAGSDARSDFFASAVYPYQQDVNVLMQLHKQRPSEGFDTAALQMNERARARSLLEALNEANADIRRGVDPALLNSERTLQQRLNATAERQTRLLSGRHTEEQTGRLQKELDALTSNYKEVEAQIRKSSPRYAALTQPAPLTVREMQSEVLDSETALLEYSLGGDRSYLWVLTSTSVKSFELPPRAEIEAGVRRVMELLSDGKTWATSAHINMEYAATANQLSYTLLPPGLMSELKVKRLVIVGDGALQYLPFGALPVHTSIAQSSKPGNGPKVTGDEQPLIAQYEIVTLPSASTLAVLRRETANRKRPAKTVAVLADPVFEVTDERVRAATARSHKESNRQSTATTDEKGFNQLIKARARLQALDFKSNGAANGAIPGNLRMARLPFTSFEAENILASAPNGQNLKATGFRANRETATGSNLSEYRFVHFATHGILNSDHPELSGIVLSLVNERGQPEDGFLRLNEIYNLNLPADLVVLSACQTGLGKEIRGEGLVGLTRGFMYAGAPRVVASLWRVDDAATAELMKRFYQAMLKDKLRPAAALQAAKISMWQEKRWRAPFYWAAFELQGEWR